MDDILSQVFDACKLARDLESCLRLSTCPIDPRFLLGSCEDIAGAFSNAVHVIRSQTPSSCTSQLLFREASGEGYMQAIHLLRQGDHPFCAAGPSANDMAFSGLPHLVPEIQSTGAMGGSSYANTPDTDVDALVGGRGEAPVAPSGRTADGSLQQRSCRKRWDPQPRDQRKEGTVTQRVPVLRTGNMEIPPNDGYKWRKYGQKKILNSSFPSDFGRSYYHCNHKSYYRCDAKKMVQRSDDDPYTFQVTYCGSHTCHTSPTPKLIPTLVPSGSVNDNDDGGNGNPQGAPLGLEAMHPVASQSTPIHLQNWLEGNPSSTGALLVAHSGVSSRSSRQVAQVQGGRDIDCSVADALLNTASSGSSMDVIVSPTHGE
ncbi:unnamed protein product [Musa acuminata subsp. malaccensis]|uniref:(wild Malaysian banana) hypothetical protein n=1 Tax=Musa acuminata subsp. malaccensis TaxID=214687 RepID=A0A804KG08_MUSAM|nr:unnamed protein product [Musa acuminata subsp. malaccensis]